MRTVQAVIGAVRNLRDFTADIVLAPVNESAPWVTVRSEDYPAGLWPPVAGDVVTVSVPTVTSAKRELQGCDHGVLGFCAECLPHERTVTVEDVSGQVFDVPVSEAPRF